MSTRMRINTKTEVYHAIAADNDAPGHNIATSADNVQDLGSSSDFEIDTDNNISPVKLAKIATTTGSQIWSLSSVPFTKFIYIKHTGYTSSDKTTKTTAILKWGIGTLNRSFKLSPGESITLHDPGITCDNLNDFYVESSTGDIYMEVVYD